MRLLKLTMSGIAQAGTADIYLEVARSDDIEGFAVS